MNELIKVEVNENFEPIVSGLDLWKFLEVKTPYKKWFDRMSEYGFEENVDFIVLDKIVHDDTAFGGNRKITDHAMKMDMAKEIGMLQKTEKGKQLRKYFIEVEKEFNSPEKIMARAIKVADDTIKGLKQKVIELEPKAEFAETLMLSEDRITIGDMAKILKQKGIIGFGTNTLFEVLRERGILMKTGDSKNLPTQKSIDLGILQIQEKPYLNATNGEVCISKKSMVTPKGQEYFYKMFSKSLTISE